MPTIYNDSRSDTLRAAREEVHRLPDSDRSWRLYTADRKYYEDNPRKICAIISGILAQRDRKEKAVRALIKAIYTLIGEYEGKVDTIIIKYMDENGDIHTDTVKKSHLSRLYVENLHPENMKSFSVSVN